MTLDLFETLGFYGTLFTVAVLFSLIAFALFRGPVSRIRRYRQNRAFQIRERDVIARARGIR